MATPVPLRDDYDGDALRRLARASTDANQVRRLTALAVIYDGGSWSDAAKARAMTLRVNRGLGASV